MQQSNSGPVSKQQSHQEHQDTTRKDDDDDDDDDGGNNEEPSQHQDRGEDEEKGPSNNPPPPVGPFHPSLTKVRKEVAVKWSMTVLGLFCFILCILSLYWAVLFHVEENMSALTVALVSFDGRGAPYEETTPFVGQAVEQLAREQAMIPTGTLGYKVQPPEILIYPIIIAFFSYSFFVPVYTKFLIPEGHPPLHFWQLVLLRLALTTAAYFLMALAYSLVSLAFQIPLSNGHPHGDTEMAMNLDAFMKRTFVVYWMLNWVGMYALGLASENVTMIIGQPWTALWLTFWVIWNVSTSFYSIPLAPAFFEYGYAWPLYHIVSASRTLLFDTHSRLGLNLGVLIAWCAVNTALFPRCCVYMCWKTNQELARNVPRRRIKYLVDG